MGRLVFFSQEALRALKRNGAPSLAAIVTTVVTVVLLGMLIPIFQTTRAKSEEVRGELNIQTSIHADATKGEIAELRDQLQALSHVASVEYISKPQALEELRETLGAEESEELTSALNHNPLPASFRITPDDAANLAGIRAAIEVDQGGGKYFSPIVSDIFDRQQAAAEIEEVTGALRVVLTVITALLVLASVMLVGNTIRLSIYTRRREVEVMRLVGATRWFIRWPFMIEGVIVGFVGAALAILVLWIGKVTIVDPLGDTFPFLAAQNSSTLGFPAMVAILFSASILVSTIGSGVTLRRFLKV
ncbi:MAG TPA: permease-like cell division protein FtsX [Solirubrobacterales bacterium]|nr:permease-like cell division protein FtsX [Solirubrobacterales bacterium]